MRPILFNQVCVNMSGDCVVRPSVHPMSFLLQGFQRSPLLCKSSTPKIKASRSSFIVCRRGVSATPVVKVQLVPVANETGPSSC